MEDAHLQRLQRTAETLVSEVLATNLAIENVRASDIVERAMNTLAPMSVQRLLVGMRAWMRWYGKAETRQVCAIELIQAFADDCTQRGLLPCTSACYLWALRQVYDLAGLKHSPERAAIRSICAQIDRMDRHERPRATALRRGYLEQILAHVDVNRPSELADAALLVVLHETVASHTEILGKKVYEMWAREPLQVSHVRRLRDGSGRLRLSAAKDQPEFVLSAWAMQWIDAWLRASKLTSGALFRVLRKGESCFLNAPPLQERTACKRFKRLIARAGVDGKHLTLRSLRIGAVNELLHAGMHPETVRRAARWSSTCRVAFHQLASMTQSPAEELAAHFARTRPVRTSLRTRRTAPIQLALSL